MASPQHKRTYLGLLLVVIGTIFLLDNLGYTLEIPDYLFSWPAIFVAIGIVNALSGKGRVALTFFGLAIIFYLHYFDVIDLSEMWPLILILVGLTVIFKKIPTKKEVLGSTEDQFDETAIFGGIEKKFISQNLNGGTITSIFGGCEVDLRGSQAQEGAVIEIFCMFGGVELFLPRDWKVVIDTTAIFGGFSDDRRSMDQDFTATVYIKGLVLFGGGEIKN